MITAERSSPHIYILGIDPSTGSDTSAVGAVVVEYCGDPSAPPRPGRVVARRAFEGSTVSPSTRPEAQLWERLQSCAGEFQFFLRHVELIPVAFDIVAFERPFVGLNKDTALKMAYSCGALLTSSRLRGAEIWSVCNQSAKAVAGASKQPRDVSKSMVQEWVERSYPGILDDCIAIEREAIADALAVAEAAYRRWHGAERKKSAKAAQLTLKLRRDPVKRGKAKVAA